MWRSYRVPKTGQIIKKSSTYQMVMANSVALSSRVWMNPFSLKMLATRHTRDGFDILNPKTGQRTKADLDTLGQTLRRTKGRACRKNLKLLCRLTQML